MFRDRRDAGKQLAVALARYAADKPVVMALPRGGVPVAREVADALGAPLDVLVVRKLAVPSRPELGMGAVAEEGAVYLDQKTLDLVDLSDQEIQREVRAAQTEVARRATVYRHGRPRLELKGRTVILVDDGVATGGTIRAALAALARAGAGKVVLACPVITTSARQALRPHVSEVVCIEDRPRLGAINRAYREFRPLQDTDVVAVLQPAAGAPGVLA